MNKYRIIEEGGNFYPQEKKTILSPWKFLDNYWESILWLYDRHESICNSMEDAIEVIEKRIEFLGEPKKVKKVIHKYPLTLNNEGGDQ